LNYPDWNTHLDTIGPGTRDIGRMDNGTLFICLPLGPAAPPLVSSSSPLPVPALPLPPKQNWEPVPCHRVLFDSVDIPPQRVQLSSELMVFILRSPTHW
jgi:hypothetical protein